MGVIEEFENKFVQWLGLEGEAVAVNNGTAAITATLMALDVAHTQIITTPFTFMATINAILMAKATPTFVDIDEEKHLLDYSKIDSVSHMDTVILPVHLFGRCCNNKAIRQIADKHGLFVVEDAAQSLGNPGVGRYSDAACFSFYKTKNLWTFEGGMIFIPKQSRVDIFKLRAIINQGQDPRDKKLVHKYVGANFRIPEICALIGLQHLNHSKAILSELGNYDESNGYYPMLAYQQLSLQKMGIGGNCPIAEKVAAEIASQAKVR